MTPRNSFSVVKSSIEYRLMFYLYSKLHALYSKLHACAFNMLTWKYVDRIIICISHQLEGLNPILCMNDRSSGQCLLKLRSVETRSELKLHILGQQISQGSNNLQKFLINRWEKSAQPRKDLIPLLIVKVEDW